MSQDDQDTRESPALEPDEVQFSTADAESVGDPAAAGTDAEGDPGSASFEAPGAGETAATATSGEPSESGAPAGSPAAAQERAAGGESALERPEVQILGAFVGAFILAKLLHWLFSRD